MTFKLYCYYCTYIHTWVSTTVGRLGPINKQLLTLMSTCPHPPTPTVHLIYIFFHLIPAAEVTLSNLTLASRTATTLSVTWSAGYPKCYSFTVSHSTQDGSINVTQPADSDTSHTLTSLQPGTTYRIVVEAVRKGDGADGQRAKLLVIYTTDGPGMYIVLTLLAIVSYCIDDCV